jgi:5-methylcytosine-specific restriction protein A
MFIIGQEYTKRDIYSILSVPENKQRGEWDKGCRFYENMFFIFANVGVAGRTQHNYPNNWTKEGFEWYGQTQSSLHKPQIRKLISGNFLVHIFTRNDNLAPFKYEGNGVVLRFEDTIPIKIIWALNSDNALKNLTIIDENYSFVEGSVKVVGINKYERNAKARKECIKHFGYRCQICSFNFKKVFGNIGENYIHVHHIKPISTIEGEYIVNPTKDLIPICPNCHAMIHSQNPPLTVDELKKIIANNLSNV